MEDAVTVRDAHDDIVIQLSLNQVQALAALARTTPDADALQLLRLVRTDDCSRDPVLELESVGALPRAGTGYEPLGEASVTDVLLRVYMAEAPAGFVEPLCVPDRLEMAEVAAERECIVAMYKKQEASFWTTDEIDLAHDMGDWEALSDGERFFLTRVLAFFAQADGLVADNCSANFADEITWREFRGVFTFQGMMEHIHNLSYNFAIFSYVRDPAERHVLFNAIEHIPTIAAKANWMRRYMSRDIPLAARLVAFVVAEGVFFSGAFCSIFWMRKRGKLPGLGFTNELISRDEGMHADTTCMAYSFIVRRLPEAYVHALFRDAVAIEHTFVREALPVSLIGMNSDLMCAYIEFVASFWLQRLGYNKLSNVACPFEWMDLSALDGKSNFFERRVGEYARKQRAAQAPTVVATAGLEFDEDF